MVTLLNKTFKYKNISQSFCCAIIMAMFLMIAPTKLYADEVSNSEVKASWIYTIIDWLDWRGHPKNEKYIICAIGRDKVYMYLKRLEMTKGNKKSNRVFVVENKATGDDLKGCNILYISESEQEYYTHILETVNGAKWMITISSIGGFARHGGAIEFVIRKKARLIINMTSVKNAKVSIDEDLSGWVETIY